MRPSPARSMAPEPQAWIPIGSLEALPELEELLDSKLLVESGATRAVRVGADGQGYFADPTNQSNDEIVTNSSEDAHQLRKRQSQHRTLKLKRRTKYQRLIAASLIVVFIGSIFALIGDRANPSPAYGQGRVLAQVPAAVPIYVPIVIEGKKEMRLSVANDLEGLIAEQGLQELASSNSFYSRSLYTTKRSAPAMEFSYVKNIAVTFDGQTKDIETSGLTVGDVLTERGIVVSNQDIVTPSKDTMAMGVGAIAIQRVTTQTRSEERVVAFATERRNDSSLAKGKTKETQKGVNGKELVTFTQTLADGEVTSEAVSETLLITPTQNRIVNVGTKSSGSSSSSNSSSSSSSSSPRGSESGVASFYGAPGGTCAHKTLPFGTIITVTNVNNGKTTTCRVADRGPFIAGRVIDLSKDRFSAIASLSSGLTSVRLSW